MSSVVVLASNNRGKLAELAALLSPHAISVRSLSEYSSDSVEETGSTFHANALLKARFAARVAKFPAVADDSGLEVDALGGAPGVYSARYAGLGASDAENNAKLLTALVGVPIEARTARFRSVLAYVEHADARPIFAEGVWEGRILVDPRGTSGFGYDPLFLPDGSVLTAGEMTMEIKNRLSHRAQAMQSLLRQLFPAR